MDAQLSKIAAIAAQPEKIDAYKALISSTTDAKSLNAVVSHLVAESTQLVVSRQVLLAFAQAVEKLPADTLVEVGQFSLGVIAPRLISFEDSYSTIAEALAKTYESQGKFRAAADTYSLIPLNSDQRAISDKQKLTTYMSIADNYIKASDFVAAEKCTNRAAVLEKEVKDAALSLRFKIANATVLDFRGKLLEASRHFFELSQQVEASRRLEFLQQAINTCILSAAGPQRNKVLTILYKDDFASKAVNFGILETVYHNKLVRGKAVADFAAQLKPHHTAQVDGFSVLDNGLVQHNLLAASDIYHNMSFQQMGALLQVAPEKAEKIAAQMIMDKRLAASIDQIEGMVSFEASAATLPVWDKQIENVCHSVDRVMSLLQRVNPALVSGL
eukprot:TRINITY_DN15160_c0_g1_i1.p1 TRINITY_DN15160_c0_g1~~TRINITY_DN15160_c0_g1_i1.p1  ORF type:complete len:405 (-),score=115.14 TRINITY_DN15160_c0_g1_i1:28-1188(-)